jgi:hypothetical protein
MRRAFQPIRRLVTRITLEEAAALIRRDCMKPDGMLPSEKEARSWARTLFLHLTHEPGSRPPRLRTRPERPTAERLDRFTQLERDWIRRTPKSVSVRMR